MRTHDVYAWIDKHWVWVARTSSALLIKVLDDRYNDTKIVELGELVH